MLPCFYTITMTAQEYFGDWMQVIPQKEMNEVLQKLKFVDKSVLCPEYKNIFKAFNKCPYRNLRLVVLGQDPYPQKDIATGIAFANKESTSEYELSPSLKVIKESVINYEVPHNLVTFAPTLEDWEEQGVLLLNTSLTCRVNESGSHSLLWRPFVSALLRNISMDNTGIVFLLLGGSAKSFRECVGNNHYVITEKHPSYYYRCHTKMPYTIWQSINDFLIKRDGYGINFYKEEL